MIEDVVERIAVALEDLVAINRSRLEIDNINRRDIVTMMEETKLLMAAPRGTCAAQAQENARQVNEAAEAGEVLTEPVKSEPKKDKKKKETPPAAPAATADVTVEAVRDALVALSAAKGKDVALSILKEVGQADKLSSVDTAQYPKLLKACEEAKNA